MLQRPSADILFSAIEMQIAATILCHGKLFHFSFAPLSPFGGRPTQSPQIDKVNSLGLLRSAKSAARSIRQVDPIASHVRRQKTFVGVCRNKVVGLLGIKPEKVLNEKKERCTEVSDASPK